MNFKGKNVIVTGSSSGIGSDIANEFVKHGAMVYGISKYDNLSDKCSSIDNFKYYDVDVTDYKSVKKIVEDILAKGPVDILINNAGIKRDGSMLKQTQEIWEDVINVNLNAVFHITQLVALSMKNNKSGCIINISSISASRCAFGQSNYVSSKGAIESFTRACSIELAPYGVRVNCIAPGCIQTELWNGIRPDIVEDYKMRIPMRRFGEVNEVSQLALFLSSSHSSYITGEVIHINGGLLGAL